jgi:hypothetical protein
MSRRWSRGRLLLLATAVALVVLFAFGDRIGDALYRWLLALHGVHA